MTLREDARTVVGTFQRPDDAQNAVRDLLNAGYDRNDVSLMQRPDDVTGHTLATGEDPRAVRDMNVGTAVGGAVGLLGGVWLFFIPGIGPAVIAGGIVAMAVGALGGSFLGQTVGALAAFGIDAGDAEGYGDLLRAGGAVVAVRCCDPDDVPDVNAILARHHSTALPADAQVLHGETYPAARTTVANPPPPPQA